MTTITFIEADGTRHELSPSGDQPGTYVDGKGRPAYRSKGLGSRGQIYRLADQSIYVYWETSAAPACSRAAAVTPTRRGASAPSPSVPRAVRRPAPGVISFLGGGRAPSRWRRTRSVLPSVGCSTEQGLTANEKGRPRAAFLFYTCHIRDFG